jgi:uncharacterized protein involved in cysteine biosynthesis
MRRAASSFAVGFGCPFAGLRLIAVNPRVRHRAIIPFAITALVFLVGIVTGFWVLGGFISALVAETLAAIGFTVGTWAYAAAFWPVAAVVAVASAFAWFYLLFLVSRLIAMPFYSLLAETVLVEQGLMPAEDFRLGPWLKTNARLVRVSLLKLLVFSLLAAVLFTLSFVPFFGVAASFGFLLLGAFDIVDVSLEALRLGLRDRVRFFFEEFPAFAGLAVALGLVFLIPGLNFFLFPAAVSGACEIIRLRQTRRSS